VAAGDVPTWVDHDHESSADFQRTKRAAAVHGGADGENEEERPDQLGPELASCLSWARASLLTCGVAVTSMTTRLSFRRAHVDTGNGHLPPPTSGSWAYLLAVNAPVRLPELPGVHASGDDARRLQH
jgi:hypothetical protein